MAAGDAFVIEDTGAETNRSHTVEADRGLAGTPTLEQGDFSGQWTSPDLTIPNTAPILAGYSDFLRSSGTARSGSVLQFRVGTTNQGMIGGSSWGYNRLSGGADESARHGVFLDDLTANDDLQMREATVLNGSDRIGDYDRSAGDPRGFWAVELPDNDHLFASLSVAEETGAGRYGNAPRPIDLGTPSALSEGSFAAIDSFNTDSSQGTTITRSGGDFTVAANSKVLCVANFQVDNSATDRNSGLIRMDKDGSPYAWISVYIRNTSSDIMTGSINIPVVTGGSSEIIDFSFVEQVEETVPEVNLEDANVRFFDLTEADMCILGKTDADVTSIAGTAQQISYPAADEILVDSASFAHPGANLTRIENNAGSTITVLAGFTVMCDSTSAASTTRKTPGSRLRRSGTQLDYMCASEFARGNQGGDDQFTAGYSFCAPVELTSAQHIEHDIFDFAGNAAVNLIVNASDDAAVYFWAIRLDDLGVAEPSPGTFLQRYEHAPAPNPLLRM